MKPCSLTFFQLSHFYSFRDRKDIIGEASCKICQESFITSINGQCSFEPLLNIISSLGLIGIDNIE
jgi:hypothetical protein